MLQELPELDAPAVVRVDLARKLLRRVLGDRPGLHHHLLEAVELHRLVLAEVLQPEGLRLGAPRLDHLFRSLHGAVPRLEHRARGLEPVLRLQGQTLEDEVGDRGRGLALVERRRRLSLQVQDVGVHRGLRALCERRELGAHRGVDVAAPRQVARQDLVQDDAHREHVRRGRLRCRRLGLRRKVGGRALRTGRRCGGRHGTRRVFAQPEVDDHDMSAVLSDDVRPFQVTVQNVLGVHGTHPADDLSEVFGSLRPRDLPSLLNEVFVVAEAHHPLHPDHVVVLATVAQGAAPQELHHVLVLDHLQVLPLALPHVRPCWCFRLYDFQSHQLRPVLGLVHTALGPTSELVRRAWPEDKREGLPWHRVQLHGRPIAGSPGSGSRGACALLLLEHGGCDFHDARVEDGGCHHVLLDGSELVLDGPDLVLELQQVAVHVLELLGILGLLLRVDALGEDLAALALEQRLHFRLVHERGQIPEQLLDLRPLLVKVRLGQRWLRVEFVDKAVAQSAQRLHGGCCRALPRKQPRVVEEQQREERDVPLAHLAELDLFEPMLAHALHHVRLLLDLAQQLCTTAPLRPRLSHLLLPRMAQHWPKDLRHQFQDRALDPVAPSAPLALVLRLVLSDHLHDLHLALCQHALFLLLLHFGRAEAGSLPLEIRSQRNQEVCALLFHLDNRVRGNEVLELLILGLDNLERVLDFCVSIEPWADALK
mmetsp:Transcript_45192/g.107094  ORF Transcript_45192/g.107094 Transcript_45192/m.107094 type:complete len:708 (-) Transcript_45192:739-2862(-)